VEELRREVVAEAVRVYYEEMNQLNHRCRAQPMPTARPPRRKEGQLRIGFSSIERPEMVDLLPQGWL